MKSVHHVYIASHGCQTTITGSDGKPIPHEEISKILEKISDRNLYGIYFGSCLFGEQTNTVMRESKESATWIAGYTTSVAWMSAALLDLFYWNTCYWRNVVKSKRAETMLEYLFTLFRRVPHLFKELGFRVTLRLQRSNITFPDDVFPDGWWNPKEEYEKFAKRAENAIVKITNKEKPLWWRKQNVAPPEYSR